jgi:uncharacterized membrane protein YtjA (UPF0391 family)
LAAVFSLTLQQVFLAKRQMFTNCEEFDMLNYAVIFLVIALIAAVFGFGGIAAGAVEIAKILFFVFVILAIISFVVSMLRKK